MDSLLNELKKLDYSAEIVAKRREEQRKEWLNSRRDDSVQQNSNKRRRFNPCADDCSPSVVCCSEQVEAAKKLEHSPYAVSEQSDRQSNT